MIKASAEAWRTVSFTVTTLIKSRCGVQAGSEQNSSSSSSSSYPCPGCSRMFCSTTPCERNPCPRFWVEPCWVNVHHPNRPQPTIHFCLIVSFPLGWVWVVWLFIRDQIASGVHSRVKLPLITAPGLIRGPEPVHHDKGNYYSKPMYTHTASTSKTTLILIPEVRLPMSESILIVDDCLLSLFLLTSVSWKDL